MKRKKYIPMPPPVTIVVSCHLHRRPSDPTPSQSPAPSSSQLPLLKQKQHRASTPFCDFLFWRKSKPLEIGNAVVNYETDELGKNDFYWSCALNSNEIIRRIHKYCDFSPSANVSKQFQEATDAIDLGSIDDYDIYTPLVAWAMSTLTISFPQNKSKT